MATINLGRIKPVNKGTWSNSTAYAVDDFVQYTDNGVLSTYIAVATSTNQTPSTSGTVNSTYWKFMAKGVASELTGLGNNKIVTTDGSGNVQALSMGTATQILKVNSGANGFEFGDAPSGKVKQAITKTANHNFGTISNNNSYHLSQLDITFTALETDPVLFLSGEVPCDNSNSSNFGVDLGFKVVNNTDSTDAWAYKPNQHLLYSAGTHDKYFPARKTILWESGSSNHGSDQNTSSGFITAGDSITIQTYIRCNDSNMAYFGGNNGVSNYDVQLVQVWEIK